MACIAPVFDPRWPKGESIMILLYIAAAMQAADLPTVLLPSTAHTTASSVEGAEPQNIAASPGILLRQDTPVELMAISEVSTARVTPGTVFKLRVNRAIEVDGRVVVPVGTRAYGEVITARDAGGLGKSGRMTARLLHIELGDVKIPLEGEMSAKGTGAGSAGVAILLAGWAGFFHRGNNAKIKAGEILAGFVARDVLLNVDGAAPPEAPIPSASPVAAQAAP
jgi:hypothetical protein